MQSLIITAVDLDESNTIAAFKASPLAMLARGWRPDRRKTRAVGTFLALRHSGCRLPGIHRNTVWNRARAGRLPAPMKSDGLTVWRRKDIDAFVDGLAGKLAAVKMGTH